MAQRTKVIAIAVVVAIAIALALSSTPLAIGQARAQQPAAIEDELILITPVAKTLTDPTLLAQGRDGRHPGERSRSARRCARRAAARPVK